MDHEDSRDLANVGTDPLTGLESYILLRSLARASAIAFVDIHDIQGINTRHGHLVADVVLKTVALRLKRQLCPWRMFRVGGDEFLIAVEGFIDRNGAIDLARRIESQIVRPIEGIDEPITAHIGISLRPVVNDGFEVYLVAQDLADVARRDNRPFFVADADWQRGRPVFCGEPIATRPATLIRQLTDLSDRQRLDFAIWSMDIEDCPSAADSEWGQRYLDQAGTERAAVLAFQGLRHDGTVSDATGSSFFDPVTGWGLEAWARATSIIRVMAQASSKRDVKPEPCVARALLWMAAPPVYAENALDHRSSTYLTFPGLPKSSPQTGGI